MEISSEPGEARRGSSINLFFLRVKEALFLVFQIFFEVISWFHFEKDEGTPRKKIRVAWHCLSLPRIESWLSHIGI